MRAPFVLPLVSLAAVAFAAACPGAPGFPPADAGPEYAGVQGVVALAGADLHVLEGSRVQLDGHASRSLRVENDLVLAWSQIEGPSVVLTNPSAPSPAFVAPLSPATLRFRLRAESGGAAAFDEVTVEVLDRPGRTPFFVEVPRDLAVASGEDVTFTADVVGAASGSVTLEAEARCDGDVSVSVDGEAVTVAGTRELPCLIVVDAVDEEGRRSAPAARALWPQGAALPTATRLSAPVVVEPSALVPLRFDGDDGNGTTTAWPAGGSSDGLLAAATGPEVTATSPMRRTRMVLAGEARVGPASGGVRYAFVDVTAGAGNRAPIANGGNDRRVRPGASFTLTTSGSSDLDGDPLLVDVFQVIGPAAPPDDVQPGLFHAPDGAEVLLFHVTAFDGRVRSDPDTVRVVVDPDVQNEEPILDVEPVRWVAPGTSFRIDASAAYDPDSGFIDRWSIAQDPNDAVVLLPFAVEEPFVELTAGANGDVYRFRLSAFDEEGQGAYADVEVIVERAGPYVDAATGDDEQGDGTASSPFASVGAALEVALRHQLPELRVASGPQLPFAGRVEGIDIVGGFERSGSEWSAGDERSHLPVASGGVVVQDAVVSRLAIDLGAADASLTLAGTSALASVGITEGPLHQGPLLLVSSAATATLLDVTATASSASSSEAVLVSVKPGAALRLSQTTLTGGAGGDRVGLSCDAATLDLIGADVVATTGAAEGTGILATGCDIQILDSHVSGGTATQRAVGLRATDTLLYIAPNATLSGASLGSSSSATGLLIEGGDAPVVITGTVIAVEVGAATAVGTAIDAAARVAVSNAKVSARATDEATGVLARADGVQITGADIHALSASGRAVAVDLIHADDVILDASSLSAVGIEAFGVRAAAPEGVLAPRLNALFIDVTAAEIAAGIGLGTSRALLGTSLQVTVHVPGGATAARGLGLRDGNVRDSSFVVTGGGEVLGVVVATGGNGAALERCSVVVESAGGSAVAVLGGAPLTIASSFLRARSPANALGLDTRAAATLRHATIWADGTAVLGSASGAVVDAANSVLVGETGFERTAAAPAPLLATHLALAAARPWVNGLGEVASTLAELEAAGCAACFALEDAMLDETGHLAGADGHPLVDEGSSDYAAALDIDGDAIPSGALPDIGCDELVVIELEGP